MISTPPREGLAQQMFERALDETARQVGNSRAELAHALRRGNCYECEPLRQHLAQQVAAHLAGVEPRLRAVYRFDPTFAFGEDDREREMPSESAAIDLLVWTEDKTAGLVEQVAALHHAFAEARQDWLCPQAVEWCFGLNIVLVDDREVKARQGYAALIDSLWVRPTRLWSRL